MSRNKIAIIKDLASFSGATFVVQNVSFLLAVFVRRHLGPEEMGIWALMQVFLGYASYTNFGMYDAIYREIPILAGNGDSAGVERVKNAAFTFTFSTTFSTSVLFFAGTLVYHAYHSDMPPALFYGFLCSSLINLLQKIGNLFQGYLAAEKKFEVASWFKIFSALVNAALVFGCVLWNGLYGYFVAAILSFIFNLVYLVKIGRIRVKFIWNRPEFMHLVNIGGFFMLLSLANVLITTVDDIAITNFLGLKELGLYTLGNMAGGYLVMLPNMFQQVLSPRIIEKFGDSEKKGLKTYSTLPANLVSVYFALFIGLLWITTPWLCATWLPKFTQGIPALKWLILGIAFSALARQVYPMLVGHLSHKLAIPCLFVFAGIAYIVDYFVTRAGGGFVGIAVVTAGLYLAHYLLYSWLALKGIYGAGEVLKHTLSSLMPLFMALGVLMAIDNLWGIPMTFFGAFLQSALYLILWLAMVFMMEGRFGLVKMFRETVMPWTV